MALPATPPDPDGRTAGPDQPPTTPGPPGAADEPPAAPGVADQPPAAPGVADQPPPPPPPGAPPPGAPSGAPAAPRPRRWLGLKIGLAVGAGVVVLGGAAVAAAFVLLGEDVPEVGACLSGADDPTEIVVVDCGSDRAAWRVIGHGGARSEGDFNQAAREDICQAFPDWENALWLRTNVLSGDGEVVCLAPAGPEAPPG